MKFFDSRVRIACWEKATYSKEGFADTTRLSPLSSLYRGDSILDCVLTTGIKLTGSHYSCAPKHVDRPCARK